MPLITIDDKATRFSYLDSGKPPGEHYTTLVIIHGLLYNSNVFQNLLPFAPSKGLRLICLDRRDYCDSTPYNTAELKVLREGTDTERATFMEARGVEIAAFMYHLIDELSLPAPNTEGTVGGLALVGWSLGNFMSLSTVAYAAQIPAHIQQRLQQYLRKLVVYDPPSVALGIPGPNGYDPYTDPKVPREDASRVFVEMTAHASMSPHLKSIVDLAPGLRSECFFLSVVFAATFYKQTNKVLFDPTGTDLWPKLDIWFLYGDKKPWEGPYVAEDVEKRAKAGGVNLKMHMMLDADHFVVWDQPEKAINAFAHILRN